MFKDLISYTQDLISFYKKHKKFIIKAMAITATIEVGVLAYINRKELKEYFQRLKFKLFAKKEELTSGGLDYEAPEDEEKEEDDDNSVVASF